jgi:polyferredoxin
MNDEVLKLCGGLAVIIGFIIIGRLFCGKVCPAGYLQDLIYKIPFPIKIKTFKFDKYLRLLKYFSIIMNFFLLPILVFFGLYHTAQNDVKAEPSIIMVIVFTVMVAIIVIIRRPFCKYLCPIGAVSSLFNKISFYKYKTLDDKCIQCGVCIKKCKMDIIPYKMKNSLECIRCGYCKRVCPKNAIIIGFNLKIKGKNSH